MAGSPALRGGVPSARPTSLPAEEPAVPVQLLSGSPSPCPYTPPWGGVTAPGTGSSGFPIQGPQGGNDQWGRGQRLEPFHSACGRRPVGCRLARGTSPFPTQSWQDSRFMSSSATACRKHVPPRATGHWPVHWGHPSGKGGLGGAGRAPGWRTAASHPAPWTGGFPVWLPAAQTAPTRHCRVSGLLPKLELIA